MRQHGGFGARWLGEVRDEEMEEVVFEWKNFLAILYHLLRSRFQPGVLSLISNGFFMGRTLILQMYIINRSIFKNLFYCVPQSQKPFFYFFMPNTHSVEQTM